MTDETVRVAAGAVPLLMEQVAIDELRPDPANPRRVTDTELEALTRSIREFGFIDPVIARREDCTVIGGHQRLFAARKLGLKSVPVILLDLSVEQARLLNLALNKSSGSWDEELLARLLADLAPVEGIDISLSGFTEKEVGDLLRSLDARERRERAEHFDIDEALEAAKREPRTKLGDLWLLGPHRLMCGDATDAGNVERLLAGRRAQMAFVDPPYGVSLGDHGGQQRGSRRRRIKNDSLPPEEWDAFVRAWMQILLSSVSGAVYIAMSSSQLHTVRAIFDASGGHWSDYIVWDKGSFVLGRADLQRRYELLLYGWRDGATRFWCGDRDQSDVWAIPRPTDSPLHPTMKPLALVEQAMTNSSQSGDTVLDLFLGAGSTTVAAERTGRVCYGMEIDPHYCDIVVARWESFTGEKATLEAAAPTKRPASRARRS